MDDPEAPRSAALVIRELEQRFRGLWPLRARGAVIALLSGLALWRYGYHELDLVVFVLAMAGLALVVIALLVTLVGALWLWRVLRRPEVLRDRATGSARFLEAGAPFATQFALPLPRVPLLELSWSWQEPAGVHCELAEADGWLAEEITPMRRLHAERATRFFSVGDAFGLSSLSFEDRSPVNLRVLPDPGALRQRLTIEALAAAEGMAHPSGSFEGDRMEIRRYVPGDSARDILWSSYARTRQLNVRLPERSVARHRRSVVYLVAAAEDEPAAAAARVALESGSLGSGWRFGADGSPEPVDDLADAFASIARSGSLSRGHEAAGLPGFLERVAREGDDHCIVFVPGTPGLWLDAVRSAAARARVHLSLVIGVEEIDATEDRPESRLLRWLMQAPERRGLPAATVEDLVAELTDSAPFIWVVERRNGRSRRCERASQGCSNGAARVAS
jgi:uncharacterized protein (DUF58 family)